jgi:hypothetical protein
MISRFDPVDERTLFIRMAREYPARTAIFSFSLPLFVLVQLVNGYVNGGSLPLIGTFALLTVAFSIHLTRYQIAVYRRRAVTHRLGY